MVSDRSNGIYRSVVAAVVGLGLVGAAPQNGSKERRENAKAQTDAGKSAPTVFRQPSNAVEVSQPPIHDRPCQEGSDNRESDLCAQWKAADAASKAAWWAMFATFVTALGTLGLFWQIKLTREAVEDTGAATEAMKEANRISETQSENQLRAWLAFDLSEGARLDTMNGQPWIKAKFKITNMGNTPAIGVYWFCRFDVDVEPHIQMDIIYSYFRKEMLLPEKNLFPGGCQECSADWLHDGDIPSWGTGYFTIVVYYKTVFSDTLRATTALFEVHDRRNEDSGADFSESISSTNLRIVPWTQSAGMVE